MAATKQVEALTLSGAKLAVAACTAKAQELGVDMNIAVVDSSTHLVYFERMDKAKLTSISIAIDKAFTAAGHGLGTHLYRDAVWPGGAAYGLGASNGGRFTTFGGGLPVVNASGQVVGGIGASSGTPKQDQLVVQAGVDVLDGILRSAGGRLKAKL